MAGRRVDKTSTNIGQVIDRALSMKHDLWNRSPFKQSLTSSSPGTCMSGSQSRDSGKQ